MNTPANHPASTQRRFISTSGIFRWVLALTIVTLASVTGFAATGGASTGTISGRVSNSSTGDFLNNATISIGGTTVEASTDNLGFYRLSEVPAGPVKIVAAFSGMRTETAVATVHAGEVVQQDFSLGLIDVVQMEKYTVTARQLSGQAIAEQERRNAPNIKSVVSMDELGDMGEGNLGEYLKYVPGLHMEYDPQRPVSIAARGMPATGTIVMLNGAEVATSLIGTRTFDLGVSASGNIDRIEVSKVPTPDMPANAVGGTVNIIPKSGLSRTKPLLSYNVFLTTSPIGGLGDTDFSLSKKKGAEPLTSVAPNRPAYNLSYILPVNKKLAFTFSLAQSFRPSDMEFMFAIWDQVKNIETYNRPSWAVFNEKRDLAAVSAIWKMTDKQTLEASFQSTDSVVYTRQFQRVVQAGAGATGTPTSTQGAATAVGSAQQAVPWLDQYRSLQAAMLSYRFDSGANWKVELNGSWSKAGTERKDTADGFFSSVSTNLTKLIARYDGVDGAGDRKAAIVTATDINGNPVDINNGNNYSVTAANSGGPLNNTSVATRLDLNARRDFHVAFPLSVKVGMVVSRTKSETTGGAYGYSFAPPGGAAAQLASNYDLIADEFSAGHAFDGANGTPVKVQWISPYKLYNLYLAHPEYFVFGVAQQAAQYTSKATVSKLLQETIPAAYVRGDIKLFNNRLWLVGGVRFEQTQDDGYGPLNDIGATYKKDASGNYVRDSAGKLVPISTDALVTAKLRYTERGTHAQRTYEGYYPSLNSSFNISNKVTVRAAYARTIGRPDISAIVPGITITDPDSTAALKTITIINTALRPWTANNYDLTLEAYDIKGATASISAFRKDIKNFFGSVRTPATSAILADNGLTDDYLGYDVVTQSNFGAATISGIELAYRQSLAPFVPAWAKGFEIYGNATTLSLSGPNAADFTNFSPHEASCGLSFSNRKFIAKFNVQRSGWIRGSQAAASATVPVGAYNYIAPQTRVDVSAEFKLTRHLSLYGSVRNLTHTAKRQGVLAPGTQSFTELNYFQFTGTLLTMGIKGDF